MDMDIGWLTGLCVCGKEHNLLTKKIVIERGATEKLGEIAEEAGLSGNGCIICDENTAPYAERVGCALYGRLHTIKPIIVLDPAGLHADEKAVERVNIQLPGDVRWLVAVGSGTIHDITRYVANIHGISFISYPTAASVDGFVSTVCAMTWHGFKKTFPGIAPAVVVADTDIFSKAPAYLTRAGAGDVLGKYISLADWEISSLVSGEAFCPGIADLTREAVERVHSGLESIASGNADAFENLMYAQLLSGIAMQMWGNSRPASGAEHHLSHFWEMEVITPHIDALHGEKVGVGLLTVLPVYKRIAASGILNLPPDGYDGFPAEHLKKKFGPLFNHILTENAPDPLEHVDKRKLSRNSKKIAAILDALPDPELMESDMEKFGCFTKPLQIGINDEQVRESMELSPYIRNRLTLMRIIKLFDPDNPK